MGAVELLSGLVAAGGLLSLFLLGIMVLSQLALLALLALFTIYFRLHLVGSLWPPFSTYATTGVSGTVLMVATCFRAIPMGSFEAATIDGASVLQCFR